jgi:ATP-dependent DNA helicase RecG
MLQARTELRYLKGVGPRRAEKLAEQGFTTLEDLLYHLPFRYEDRRAFAGIGELVPGGPEQTISVRVEAARLIRTRRRGFTIFEAELSDATGRIKGVWYNQPYLVRVLKPGSHAVLFGRSVISRYKEPVLENPEYEFLDDEDGEGVHTGRIVPVYRKLADQTPRVIRRMIHEALANLDAASLPPHVPAEIARRNTLMPRFDALRETHFPSAGAALGDLRQRRTPAQRSLAFEEIFLLQLALALRRAGLELVPRRIVYDNPDALRTPLAGLLPFELTAAQKRVLREIGGDLSSEHPMNRLLQGDVGSGKTIVALLALLVAVENGFQGALMAPTEILAEQHGRNIRRILEQGGLDHRVVVLKGSLRAARRREVLSEIRSGAARLAIGTHALFEPGVEFRELGLVVVDEQHRFGVMQRAALAKKGTRPDVLVMTATPIPRSLALTLYGDLDLSVIDELPPGRVPIRTHVRAEADRKRVYDGLRRAVGMGRQAYVVVPLVEETARSDLKAAKELTEHLGARVFPDLEIGMVHGRMKSDEKDRVMQEFAAGRIQLLVATTVIEVGVDVPNASVMLVEHAERFGLSQLHQLRGRVGRGSARSYCVLMMGAEAQGRESRERLRVMESTSDGFQIAQRDLELRGPGAVFGTQQHGLSDLQFLAEILRAPGLIEAARAEAQALVSAGSEGRAAAETLLASLGERWKGRLALARVG